ncbi:acyltransferase family protein [Aeromicrobium sp.]|uniref:acyltransferase family protein n=1 Tax=Aeromicrobium sp. TaxID=1871063 RepID=UPI00199B7D27|nr:acyltransferase family protein [Aeromicrobium sp.]MBC7632194.1 acyltransferase family protein [Aeromicrobium sp.]
MPQTRDRRLDLSKGLLIAGVVLGHFLETSGGQEPGDLYSGWSHDPQRWVLTFLYLFHMPLFVFLAGITARSSGVAHRVAEMAGLYLLLQIAYVVPRFGFDSLTSDRLLDPTYALWFLLAMVWWLLSLPVVERLGAWALPVATAASVIAVVLPYPDGNLVAWSRALCFWPFFVAGRLYGVGALRRTVSLPPAVRVAAATALVATTTVVVKTGLAPQWFRGADGAIAMDVSGLQAMTFRVLCLGLAILCGACVLALIPAHMQVPEALGRRSLAIYALHIPMVFVMEVVFESVGLAPIEATLLAVALTIVMLRILVFPVFDKAVRRTASTMAAVAVPPVLARR